MNQIEEAVQWANSIYDFWDMVFYCQGQRHEAVNNAGEMHSGCLLYRTILNLGTIASNVVFQFQNITSKFTQEWSKIAEIWTEVKRIHSNPGMVFLQVGSGVFHTNDRNQSKTLELLDKHSDRGREGAIGIHCSLYGLCHQHISTGLSVARVTKRSPYNLADIGLMCHSRVRRLAPISSSRNPSHGDHRCY